MAGHLWMEKGGRGGLDSHVHVQATYVVKCKCEFTIAGEKRIVVPGDALYKESGVEHGCVCLEEGELLDIFTPQRDEFLD